MSASVTAASGCAWTASSSVAWVTVIAGASGTGNGSVAFRVAANPGSVRTGTVTVAGQTFTVTQAAAAIACTYTISPTSVSMDEKKGNGDRQRVRGHRLRVDGAQQRELDRGEVGCERQRKRLRHVQHQRKMTRTTTGPAR